jgi:hypothetical protein
MVAYVAFVVRGGVPGSQEAGMAGEYKVFKYGTKQLWQSNANTGNRTQHAPVVELLCGILQAASQGPTTTTIDKEV